MSDDADLAQGLEEEERSAAIRRLTSPAPVPPKRLAEGLCEVCADPIEERRRVAQPGARLCIECQSSRERLKRLFRKPQ